MTYKCPVSSLPKSHCKPGKRCSANWAMTAYQHHEITQAARHALLRQDVAAVFGTVDLRADYLASVTARDKDIIERLLLRSGLLLLVHVSLFIGHVGHRFPIAMSLLIDLDLLVALLL